MQTNKQESGNFGDKEGYSPAFYYVSQRGIRDGKNGSEADNSQGSFILPFHYHSITPPYSFINIQLMLCHAVN
jgi:hypothetical protein